MVIPAVQFIQMAEAELAKLSEPDAMPFLAELKSVQLYRDSLDTNELEAGYMLGLQTARVLVSLGVKLDS